MRLLDVHRRGLVLILVSLAALVVVISASAAMSRSTADSEIAVTMGKPKEFGMTLSTRSAKAGEVALVVRNRGMIVHEFILLKTPILAAKLQPRPEEPAKVVEPGFRLELEDVEPGQKVTVVMPLTKGHYVLLCNVDGHHAGGMRADLTLK